MSRCGMRKFEFKDNRDKERKVELGKMKLQAEGLLWVLFTWILGMGGKFGVLDH